MSVFWKVFFGFVTVCVATFAIASPISTEDWERREILRVPDESREQIIKSEILGTWSSEGFQGPLRFVVTKELGEANRLYVQWLESTELGVEIAYSVSIREFNVHPEFKIELPKCVDSDCTQSMVAATHVFEERAQTFLLTLTSLGRYKVGLSVR